MPRLSPGQGASDTGRKTADVSPGTPGGVSNRPVDVSGPRAKAKTVSV
jgi:hypothetical protein